MSHPQGQTSVFFSALLPFACIAAAIASGMHVDLLEVDAAQYAHISRSLAEGGSWIRFFDLGEPYLDKPPLIFWMTALSFKLFGAGNFAYRLPSLLFSVLAVFSTWKFALQRWSPRVAEFSALMLASSQAFFLMNQDVKTDMYLLGGLMFSVWQISSWMQSGSLLHALGAGTGLALALLAKGPIGLAIPLFVLLPDILLKKQWKLLFRPSAILALLPLFILLLPMCLGLFQQFGRKGLFFFFWEQSFGRITGESKWSNSAGPFFLVHTFAWAFLPWTLLFIPALVYSVRKVLSEWKSAPAILLPLSGFFLTFLAFTFSRFKLPHYIFVVLPFAAILTAVWFSEQEEKLRKGWMYAQGVLLVLCLSVPFLLSIYCFPGSSLMLWFLYLGIGIVFFISIQNEKIRGGKLLLLSVMGITLGNLLLNGQVYPRMLRYQTHSAVLKEVQKAGIPMERFRTLLIGGHAVAFYHPSNQIPILMDLSKVIDFLQEGEGYIYTNEMGERQLREMGIHTTLVAEFDDYPVNRPSLLFLNPATRPSVMKKVFVLRCSLILPGDESV